MTIFRAKYLGMVCLFVVLFPVGSSIGQQASPRAAGSSKVASTWRKNFKQARHNILLFDTAVNHYYNSVLFRGQASAGEVDRMINGSIAARQSLNMVETCPEEYQEERKILQEIYKLIREKELMAENKQVAFDKLEEWKVLKKRVDELIDELEECLKLD